MADRDIVDAQDANELVEGDELPIEETQEEDNPENQEKTLSVSRLNELIKKAKRQGAKKVQEQLNAALQELEQLKGQQAAPPPTAAPTPSPGSTPMGGMAGVDVEAIQRQVAENLRQEMAEAQKRQQQEALEREVQQVAEQYYGKMNQGKELYDDFEAITADFEPEAFPQLVYFANQLDNTPAVIYELSKSPSKLASLAVLVERSPRKAQAELAKLSQSIKTNEEAKRSEASTPDPLNRMKPGTNVGTATGDLSVRDYKKAAFLRG